MIITFTSPFTITVDTYNTHQQFFGRPQVTYQDTKEEEPYDPLGEDDWWDLCWDTFHIMIGVNTGKVWYREDGFGDEVVEIKNPQWLDFLKKETLST